MDRNTIMSLLVKAGENAKSSWTRRLVDLPVRDVEVDEIWGFRLARKKATSRQNEQR